MIFPGIATTLYSSTAITSTVTGSAVQAAFSRGEFAIFRLDYVTNSGTTPTLDVKIQHCPSMTGTFTDLVSFSQVTSGSGSYEVHVPPATMGVFPCLRVVLTLGGTSPNFDATVKIFTN